MRRAISLTELHERTADVVAAVRSGRRITVTEDARPVADLIPHLESKSPWIPREELVAILRDAPADPRLREDVADVRGMLLDDE